MQIVTTSFYHLLQYANEILGIKLNIQAQYSESRCAFVRLCVCTCAHVSGRRDNEEGRMPRMETRRGRTDNERAGSDDEEGVRTKGKK